MLKFLSKFGAPARGAALFAGGMIVAAGLAFGVPASSVAQERSAPASFADLAERLSPAVVNISTTQTLPQSNDSLQMPEFPPGSPFEELFKDFLERNGQGSGPPRKVNSLGSGFVIDPKGIIVTNNHVIEGAEVITVNFTDGRSLQAELVGKDDKVDLAVLRVKSDKPLPYVSFGDSDKARVGDWVLAIGNPFGLGGSVSAGIVSARNRDINAGPYDDFIQTDAAINRGNSGGPLFNMDGEVVGINTAIISPSGGSIGIGFSVPSQVAKPVVDQLIEFGETRRGWLGVRIQSVTDDMAEALGLDKPVGALVAGVTDKGPAGEAGLKTGDVITKFDGHDVPEMRTLPRLVASTQIGKTVDVDVIRDGKQKTFRVKVGKLESESEEASAVEPGESVTPNQAEKGIDTLGLTLTALTPDARSRYQIPTDTRGVLISAVDPKGPSADKGLQPGDVIVEVALEPVSSPEDVSKRVKAVKQSGKKSVLLLLSRQGNIEFVPIPLDGK